VHKTVNRHFAGKSSKRAYSAIKPAHIALTKALKLHACVTLFSAAYGCKKKLS
jgi:hypothetical protein